MQFLQRFVEQLKQLWLSMSLGGRAGSVILTAVCLAAIVGVGFWAAQPDYRVLFSSLSAEDAGAITAKLQAQGILFRLAASGTTVLVPAAQLQQVRIDLATAGLPSGGAKGYELLDSGPLGMTPFMEHVNYSRAIQAELAKTVMHMEPVAYARVHIVRPEPTPFVRDQKPTTASVVLKLKAGATLSRDVAAGIVALIANSVEGLTPENVAVIDTSGRVLSEHHANEAGTLATSQLEYRREVEKYLASKAEDMLSQLLGPGHAIVRITADLNFKRMKERRENVSPDDKVVTREKVVSRKTTPAASAQGVTGATRNLSKQPADSGTSGTGTQEEEVESSYAFSKIMQELEEEVGNVQRLNIAVMVDLPKSDASDPAAAPTMTLEVAEEIVKRAVGFKKDRDEIKISDVKLAGTAVPTGFDAEWMAAQRWQNYESIARNSSLGIAALAALLLGRMILKRLQPLTQTSHTPASKPPEGNVMLQQLSAEAQQNPDAVAQLLARWLEDSDKQHRAAA